MQENFRLQAHRRFSGLLAVLLLLTFALSLGASNIVSAQTDVPPTPSDPTWRGFSAARDALEEEKGLDLTYVRNYTFDQVEWKVSIDSCVEATPVTDYRESYFGWDFRITDLGGTTYKVRVAFDLSAVAVCDKVEDAGDTTATNNTGTTTPGTGDLPDPVAGGAATGGFELGGHVTSVTGEAKTAMDAAGMTWVKKQLVWRIGDSTGQAQGFLDEARAGGYKLLIGIVGDQTQMGNFDDYISQYSTFVGQVSALGVNAIEVWNEPNIDREWPAGQINGANYTKLLASAYNAIKSANPNTLVISGAPAPTGFFGAAGCTANGCNDDAFMSQMAAAGAAQYMDCVGLHYNEGIVPPSQTSGDPRGEYPTYYFGSMTARGYSLFGGKQVCYSELGYLSGEGFNTPISAGFAWAQNTTVAQQAAWLADAAVRAAQSGQVRLMIIWNVNFTTFNSDPMGGYAIIRPDGTCPSCSTLGQVMK
jgi:hypothetical protein